MFKFFVFVFLLKLFYKTVQLTVLPKKQKTNQRSLENLKNKFNMPSV